MRNSWIKNCLVNIRAFFTTNLRSRDNEALRRITALEDTVIDIRRFSYFNLMTYFSAHPEEADSYREEIEFLKRVGTWVTFPYPKCTDAETDSIRVQRHRGMPYVMHKGKRLYFPHGTPIDAVRQQYFDYLHTECLLGHDDSKGKPHQYQSPRVHIKPGDTLFDIGAAEGIFALDNIEIAGKVILVESDPIWIEPLRATFAPWGDKVTFLKKNIGTEDNETTITLETLLRTYGNESAFIKMDIEGAEVATLSVAKDFLCQRKEALKLSLTTYHFQHDYQELKDILDKTGFAVEDSSGHMLFCQYDMPLPPYFRKGILRAHNIK